jgi:hypothetical protein
MTLDDNDNFTGFQMIECPFPVRTGITNPVIKVLANDPLVRQFAYDHRSSLFKKLRDEKWNKIQDLEIYQKIMDYIYDYIADRFETFDGKLDLSNAYKLFTYDVKTYWQHMSCGAHYLQHKLATRVVEKSSRLFKQCPIEYVVNRLIRNDPIVYDDGNVYPNLLKVLPWRFIIDTSIIDTVDIKQRQIVVGPTESGHHYGIYEVQAVIGKDGKAYVKGERLPDQGAFKNVVLQRIA